MGRPSCHCVTQKDFLLSFVIFLAEIDFAVSISSTSTNVKIAGTQTELIATSGDIALFNDLHLHCFTWKSGGYFKVRNYIITNTVPVSAHSRVLGLSLQLIYSFLIDRIFTQCKVMMLRHNNSSKIYKMQK